MPYLKGDAPSQLDVYVPKITRAYITSRLESVQARGRAAGLLACLSAYLAPCLPGWLPGWLDSSREVVGWPPPSMSLLASA